MGALFISRFTPSLMSPADLLSIFVQRTALLRHIEDGLRESITTENKHHYLLVGPRGIGKTHLMSLIFHDLNALASVRDKVLIAWLREEEFVSSFTDLVVRLLKAIQANQPALVTDERLEFAYTLAVEDAPEYLAELLEEVIREKTLIVLAENLKQIFDGIGEEGQRRFRAFIQQTARVALVASTPSIFASVSLQTSPFYGFFEVERLTELSKTEARELLTRIAERDGDMALASFIQSSEGSAKVDTIYHLAGGNHRVYIILSQFIKGETIDDIVGPFIEMLDDLTPYYQSQIAELSPQQRKLILLLSDRKYAVSVQEIASRCFVSNQTASSQLKDLKEQGFVTSLQVGRFSRYEIREPLMRFCMEMKEARGEPIRVLVEFVQTWYSTKEINKLLELASPSANLSRRYFEHALRAPNKRTLPSASKGEKEIRKLEEELTDLVKNRKLAEVLEVQKEIASKRGTSDDYDRLGFCYAALDQTQIALSHFESALKLDPNNNQALRHQQMALLKLGRFTESIELARAELLQHNNSEAWDLVGVNLTSMGKHEEALIAFEKSLGLDPTNTSVITKAAGALIGLKRFEESLDRLSQVLVSDPLNMQALILKGFVLASVQQKSDALAVFNKATSIDPKEEQAWLGRATVLFTLDRFEEALTSCENAMELNKELIAPHFWRVMALLGLARWTEYRKEIKALLRRCQKYPRDAVTDFGPLCRLMIERFSDQPEVWNKELRELDSLFTKYATPSQLASAIANTVPIVVANEISDQTAHSWVKLTEEIFSKRREFSIALRLLRTAFRFRESGDRDVAIDLAIEERKMFLELLDLYQPAKATVEPARRSS
jgi:tetratricopeptide (TPR) repeat protein